MKVPSLFMCRPQMLHISQQSDMDLKLWIPVTETFSLGHQESYTVLSLLLWIDRDLCLSSDKITRANGSLPNVKLGL